ncbi:carbohydrate-binding module family 50 protein [Colletotrichum gloeosporioides 23]|nr:carbohydrate-binding module family 50 protein [Colletotrichum gloeosporioides 23]
MCLKENDVFCSPIAALAAFFTNPGVSIFNYINELPQGAVKPADCDLCLAARSPYFNGPVMAKAGDYCNLVTLKFAISLPDFMFLNTGINSNCTNLFAQESYYIQAVGDINNYPGRPRYVSITINPNNSFTSVPFTMLPNATITLDLRPTEVPLATGVRDNCVFYFKGDEYQYSPDVFGYWNSNCEIAASNYNVDFDSFAAWNSLITNVTDLAISLATFLKWNPAWDVVATGDSCSSLAGDNSISVDQFYAWNPAVSKDYISNFWLGQAYCVSVSGAGNPGVTTTSIPSATAAPTPPAPTYTGQPSDCNKWDVVESGDSCRSVAANNSITVDQFYDWNPAVSRDYVTNFWLGQAYCVSRSSPMPLAPTHTSQLANYNKWDVVVSGDSCASMASDNSITLN